jgi:hypothetical protein
MHLNFTKCRLLWLVFGSGLIMIRGGSGMVAIIKFGFDSSFVNSHR